MNAILTFLAAALFWRIAEPLRERAARSIPKPSWNETYLDKLRDDLLTNYDKYARPGQHYNVTRVEIGLTIYHLETDELNSTFSVATWLELSWKDPKLQWNKADYGEISEIKMADHEIWQPDIYLFNSASTGAEAVTRYGNPNTIVFPSGTVLWYPPIKFTALCEFDLYYWPFDTQHCFLKFASWARTGREIKLVLGDIAFDDQIVVISPWYVNCTSEIVQEISKHRFEETYSAHFNLTIVRKSSAYMAVVATPLIVVSVLILAQFWLPLEYGDRLIMGCCTTVVVGIFLAYFTNKIGAGVRLPWILFFYSTNFYLSCGALAEGILVLEMLQNGNRKNLPWFMQNILKGRLGRCLGLHDYILKRNAKDCGLAEELRDFQHTGFEDKSEDQDFMIKASENPLRYDWEILAIAMDRVCFLFYLFVYFFLFFAYLI